MSRQTTQKTAQPDHRPAEAPPSYAAVDVQNNMAATNPGSRPQAMLYGIVGEGLEQITRRVPLDDPPPLPENATLNAIGKPIPRFDAVQKVTGQARYTFDVQLPGMLYARRACAGTHSRLGTTARPEGGGE
jgi:xanthine dehydrogenase YagR molybdenum-binding subunit